MSKKKVIRYIISFQEEIPNKWPYELYETFEEAEAKRLYLSKTEGKVLKVVIDNNWN